MDKESFFISNFSNKFIGDDGAVIGDLVYSKDLFCENIHFKREWMSLDEISYKSMLVNISDVIVMNAKAKYALIGIKIPKNFTPYQLKELSSGFLKAAKEFDIKIIGGDTVAGDKLDISITMISKTKKPIFRSGLKVGDLLAFTGELGGVKKDLKKLQRGLKINKGSKFKKPILKDEFFYKASPFINSALDISDGLYKDLSRLSKINHVGFKFFKKIPKEIFSSGEEYEILFSFTKRNLAKIKYISKITKTPITIFAKAKRGSFKQKCKEHHFE